MKKFLKDESGATAIEYGLIAAALGLMLIALMPFLASSLALTFTRVTTGLDGFNTKTW